MAQSLKELIDQRDRFEERTSALRSEINQKIERITSMKREKVIEDIKNKAAEYGINVFFDAPEKKKSVIVEAVYRNPVNGKTWAGRGLRPYWLRDIDSEKFRIKKDESIEVQATSGIQVGQVGDSEKIVKTPKLMPVGSKVKSTPKNRLSSQSL